MSKTQRLLGVRPEVAGRNAGGLISAKILCAEYNYMSKFPRPRTGAKAAGLRFEKQVVKSLEQKYSGFISGIPFQYKTEYADKVICIPDGFLLYGKEIIVIEIKLRHTIDAWFQLRKLYSPVLQKVFSRPVRMMEICKVYEPGVVFPERILILKDVREFLTSKEEMGVLLWPR